MSKFQVISSRAVEQADGSFIHEETLEVTRTDERVAKDDAKLITDVLHRKAWLVKTGEPS
jgi:hypothetical protein